MEEAASFYLPFTIYHLLLLHLSPVTCHLSPMIELDGQRLSLEEVAAVARGAESVALSAAARERVEAARRVIEKIVAEGRVVYGVNTGFGKLSDVHIPPDELRALQLNLVRSHSCGVGQLLS